MHVKQEARGTNPPGSPSRSPRSPPGQARYDHPIFFFFCSGRSQSGSCACLWAYEHALPRQRSATALHATGSRERHRNQLVPWVARLRWAFQQGAAPLLSFIIHTFIHSFSSLLSHCMHGRASGTQPVPLFSKRGAACTTVRWHSRLCMAPLPGHGRRHTQACCFLHHPVLHVFFYDMTKRKLTAH